MSLYACSGCDYATKVRSNLNKHIKSVPKCYGSEILVTVNKIQCINCHKDFDNEIYLKQHQQRCKMIIQDCPVKEESNNPKGVLERIEFLEKTVSLLLKSHMAQEEQIKKQQEQIVKLSKGYAGDQSGKKAIKPAEKPQPKIIEYNKCEGYLEKTDIRTRDKIFLKSIKSGTPIVTLIENLFFEEKLPAFNCMCIKNKRNNEIKIYEDKCWQSKKAEETVENIINHCQIILDDWATVVEEDEKTEDMEEDPFEKEKKTYNRRRQNKGDDYDASVDKDVIEAVLELLYNKRDMIKC